MKKSQNSYIYQNSVLVTAGGVAFAALWNVLLVHRPVELLSSGVAAWWTLLCAVAVINVCGWHRTAQRVAHQSATADALVGRFRKRQLRLSAVFVLGCGFRSLIPRADVQRFGLIDSWLSSALIGRSVATAAELCFAAQWALLLHAAARGVGSRFGVAVARLLVPLIAIAELCSWSAILTTCYLGNVAEESLWALAASLLVAGGLIVCGHPAGPRGPFLAAALALGILYIIFMLSCDIPMYISRWRADEVRGREYLALGQGLCDAWSRRVVTFSWEEWRAEIPWMTLYFSVCVWWSLALVHAPRPGPDPVPNRRPPGSLGSSRAVVLDAPERGRRESRPRSRAGAGTPARYQSRFRRVSCAPGNQRRSYARGRHGPTHCLLFSRSNPIVWDRTLEQQRQPG